MSNQPGIFSSAVNIGVGGAAQPSTAPAAAPGDDAVHDVEAFGPVTTLITYSTLAEAVDLADMLDQPVQVLGRCLDGVVALGGGGVAESAEIHGDDAV